MLAAIIKQSARVLHYSALSAWSFTEEGGGIALALATLDSDGAQQLRLQAELGRQRAIRDVRLFAARVMRAVVSEIGDARPSYVWKGWVAAGTVQPMSRPVRLQGPPSVADVGVLANDGDASGRQ